MRRARAGVSPPRLRRLVERGKMSERQADREIELMIAIVDDYQAMAEAERCYEPLCDEPERTAADMQRRFSRET